MDVCDKHDTLSERNDFIIDFCFGDGYCEKHGSFTFYKSGLKIPCEQCAKEQNKCQICGGIIEMREIKFRAYNKVEKCFFYWDTSFAFGGTGKIWGPTEQYVKKDRNGKEIYEGDIIKRFGYEHKTATVKWSKRKAAFIVKFPQDKESKSLYWSKKFEVIGNIHENKEHG